MSDDLEEDEELDKDDMALLNEILNTPSAGGEDDFSNEWQSVFGASTAPLSGPAGAAGAAGNAAAVGGAAGGGDDSMGSFMPSNLLDMTRQMGGMNMGPGGMQQQQMMMPGNITQSPKLIIHRLGKSLVSNTLGGKKS